MSKPFPFLRLVVVSDGTFEGTQVQCEETGLVLPNVRAVHWSVRRGQRATCMVELSEVEVRLKAKRQGAGDDE